MKSAIKSLFLIGALAFASCSDKIDGPSIPAAGQGEDVTFTFAPQSRTMYSDEWDATDTQDLWWGNYLPDVQGDDQIKIFCKAGAVQIATYDVNKSGDNSNTAESISKTGDVGVQWGNQGVTHNFYAFYPASAAGNAFVGSGDNTIRATVGTGQSPVTYKAVLANGTTYADNALASVTNNNTQSVDNATTIYGQPDMSAAIMVAKTQVSGIPDANNESGYGYPVPLHFNVLADVLDLTLNGPVVPNTLGGNASEGVDGKSRSFITINSVTIQAKDGSTAISGDFDLNMETGKATNISGNTSIQLVTAQVTANSTLRPVLYARYNTEGTPTSAQIDHLRLRAFLIPGVIENLDELKIVLSTDCGEYTQDLGSSAMATGKIHPIKLGYFKKRGTQFDFTRWMSQLNPNIYINELSLPGSWHSTVASYQGSNASLETQYNAGIRAFEVHARNESTYTVNSVGTYTEGEPTTKTSLTSATGNDGSTSRTATFTRTTTTIARAPVTGYTLNHKLLNKNTGANLATSLPTLQSLIKGTAFAVVEIGMEGEGEIKIPINATKTTEQSQTATITQTRPNRFSSNWTPASPEEGDYGDLTTTTKEGYETSTIPAGQAWAMAVSAVLKDLADTGVVYANEITPNTTIANVAGKLVIKVNTNNTSNEDAGWTAKTPALFSRWTQGKFDAVETIALQWGQPIAPTAANSSMKWCFTEYDNIGETVNNVNGTLDDRKEAINSLEAESIKNYSTGMHNTWYECAIGGYYTSANSSMDAYQYVASVLNPYMIQVLSNPNRQACPFGLVYFNYAIDDTYSGPDLIRTIINNNAAFLLARGSSDSSGSSENTNNSAADNTNSSFESKPGNAIK